MSLDNISNESVHAASQSRIPIRNLWHMLLYVWGAAEFLSRWHVEVERAPSLDALLSRVLADLLEQRLRIGLGRNYKPVESLLSGIRGRVDFGKSIKQFAFQQGKAHCRYESFIANVPKNQIVRSTLNRVATNGDFGPPSEASDELRGRLRRLVQRLNGVDFVELTPTLIERQRLDRNDRDYLLMLAICGLLVQRFMPTELDGITSVRGLARDAMTLHRIYEQFVAEFYRVHLKEWSVSAQEKLLWPAARASQFLPTMRTDVRLSHKMTREMIVIDTKFSPDILVTGRWDNLVFKSGHLYQMYAYLRSQEDRSESRKCATGLLLYPTVNHEVSEVVEIQGHALRWETVNLMQPWEEIEAKLKSIVE